MNYIIAFLISVFVLDSCSKKTDITYLDYNKNEVKRKKKAWYTQTKFSKEGKTIFEVRYKNSKKINERSIINLNGKKKVIKYGFNNNIKSISYYKNGIKDSIEKQYIFFEKLKTLTTYKSGKKNGVKLYYSTSDDLYKSEYYRDDELNGPQIFINEEGNITDSCFYKDNKRNGYRTSYFNSKKIKSSVNYVNDKKEGKSFTFYESGALNDSSYYKKDKIQGLKLVWFEDNTIKERLNFNDGKYDGKLNTYWKDGSLKRKDIFRNGDFISGKCFSKKGTDTSYYMYEITPTYPGGEEKMFEDLFKNVKYPKMAREAGVKGKVYVQFIVEKNGEISNVKVIRGIGAGCDEESMKAVKRMKNWNPGYQDGIPVRVRYVMPVNFSLR